MDERKLTVYWCPRCRVQSERMFHFCEKGPPLFPQLDEHTRCEEIEVVPVEDVRAFLARAPAVTVAAFNDALSEKRA